MSSAAEKCPSQSFFSRKISRSKTSFPSRRDSGSKEEISQATTREIFPKSDFGPRGQTSYRGPPYDRPCRARPRNALPNSYFHGKDLHENARRQRQMTIRDRRKFLRQQRAR